MTAAHHKTQNEAPLSAPQSALPWRHCALDALEEASVWYFDSDGGGLKNFVLSLDAGALGGIVQAFLALDLAAYDATTCGTAVWLFDRAMPLPTPQKGFPVAPRKPRRKRQKCSKNGQGVSPRILWPTLRRCAPSCL